MTDSTPPPWVDDLFPFPTPPALRTLVDAAWQHAYEFYLENDTYDYCLLESYYGPLFDLAAIPRPPDGCDCYPEFTGRIQSVPHYATPEFEAFGSLGDGGYVGWLVPAPELGRLDHPVALASGHDHGVTLIGTDTRTGLEFMLSSTHRRWRERPELAPPAWRDPEVWLAQNQYLIDARAADRQLLERLAAELGVHPDPDRPYPGSSWNGTAVVRDAAYDIGFDVPPGWRHETGEDGIGVLAPSDAFGDRAPLSASASCERWQIDLALDDASEMLDAGHPATALLGLKDSFVAAPSCYFADLTELWARAYRDLGRPEFAERLHLMTPMYQPSCFCRPPH